MTCCSQRCARGVKQTVLSTAMLAIMMAVFYVSAGRTDIHRCARNLKYTVKDKIPNTPFILASLSLHISAMGA